MYGCYDDDGDCLIEKRQCYLRFRSLVKTYIIYEGKDYMWLRFNYYHNYLLFFIIGYWSRRNGCSCRWVASGCSVSYAMVQW